MSVVIGYVITYVLKIIRQDFIDVIDMKIIRYMKENCINGGYLEIK